MAYSNAQLIRALAGDAGSPARETFTGDGTTTSRTLQYYPILAASEVVLVAGVALVEGAGAGKYTLDDESGVLTFGTAPALSAAIVVTYRAVRMSDGLVSEVCRQHGLTDTAEAATGPSRTSLEAAATLAEAIAASVAGDYDFDTDGQSFKRTSAAKNYADKAIALRAQARKAGGLTSNSVTKIDGYSVFGEYTARDYAASDQNPRRAFYGERDRVP